MGDMITDITSNNSTSLSSSKRSKGGRPIGTTKQNLRKKKELLIAVKNEIAQKFWLIKKSAQKKNTRVKKGVLEQLIEETKKENKSKRSY